MAKARQERPASHEYRGTRALRLWISWLLGPVAWALHENASYLLTPWVCAGLNPIWLHLTTLLTLALAATGGVVAWRQHRRIGAVRSPDGDRSVERSRFLAMIGLVLSAFSFAGILVEALPNFVLDACLGIH